MERPVFIFRTVPVNSVESERITDSRRP